MGMAYVYVEEPPPERCVSRSRNQLRCVGMDGHPLPHWAPLSEHRALRWGGETVGCFEPECNRDPGHDLPHRNGMGKSWWPYEPDEEEETQL